MRLKECDVILRSFKIDFLNVFELVASFVLPVTYSVTQPSFQQMNDASLLKHLKHFSFILKYSGLTDSMNWYISWSPFKDPSFYHPAYWLSGGVFVYKPEIMDSNIFFFYEHLIAETFIAILFLYLVSLFSNYKVMLLFCCLRVN